MYTLRRITTEPASPMQVRINQPDPDSGDAGLTQGGSFYFSPAGEDGDTCGVSDYAAGVVMSDPSLAKHFECTPPWKPAKSTAVQDDQDGGKKKRGK